MPIQIDQHLIDDLVKRQIEHDTVGRTASSPSTERGLTPSMLALLGAAADGTSTYGFLKQSQNHQAQIPFLPKSSGPIHHEDNAMYGLLKNNPVATGLSVAGTGLIGAILARKILGKRFPKIADALIANQGANQIGLAGRNIGGAGFVNGQPASSAESYNDSITQAIRRSHAK